MAENKVFDAESAELIKDISDVPDELVRLARSQNIKDASETMTFARALETVKNRMYEKKYAELKGRTFVPFSDEGGDASEYMVYRVWDVQTMAKVVVNYATDFPLVSASASEVYLRYADIGDAYGYSIQDMRNAAKAGVALDTKLAAVARMGIELGIDDAVANGLPTLKTYGLTNHPNVTLGTLTNGTWASATGEQILEDLNYIVTLMLTNTKEIFAPDTILMSTAAYRKVVSKLVNSAGSGSLTVKQAFEAQNDGVKLASWTRLSLANAGGTNGRIVAYKRDPEVLEFEMGKEFEIFPGQQQGLMMVFPCKARLAGLAVHHPLAISYFDNQTL